MLTPTAAILALSLCAPAALTGGAEAAALKPALAGEPNYSTIVSDRSPAMANIKFVLSLEFQGQSQDIEMEAMGLMIDSKGLLVLSNSEMGGGMQMIRRGIAGTPKDIKIMLGDDTEGVPAKLIGRDSELDLAWLRIDKPSDKGYSSIDLAKAAMPKIGETLVGIDRMSKYFDHAPVIFTTSVGGITKKPRTLYIPSGGLVLGMGLPMFTTSGEFVGISSVQMPNADSEDDVGSRGRERLSYFDQGLKVMPAAELATATARAVEAEKAGKGVGMDEKKEGEKKEGEKKDDEKKEEPKNDDPMKK